VAAHAAGRVTGVVLTDHNRLASRQEALLPSVIDIIDHHVDEGAYPATAHARIELVGSCCTLVAQAMAARETCAGVMESPAVALLLQGAVLLDTAKLDPEQKRATAADHEVAAAVAAAAAAAGASERSVPSAVPLKSLLHRRRVLRHRRLRASLHRQRLCWPPVLVRRLRRDTCRVCISLYGSQHDTTERIGV